MEWRFARVVLVFGAVGLGGAVAFETSPGVSGEGLAEARRYSEARGGTALVVLTGGRVTAEHYANGGGAERAVELMSLTKNLVAVAGFAAQAEGLLDLDERVSATIPAWKGRRWNEDVTLRELLNQTSGLAPGNASIYGRRGKTTAALGLAAVTEPGTQFDYGAGNLEVFGEVLRRKLERRGTTPLAYVRAKVLRPIGATVVDWARDRYGALYFSTGAAMTARDVAKFGELVRTGGRAGVLAVIPAGEFAAAREGTAANAMYGLTFWLNRNARREGAREISVEGTLGDELAPARWRQSALSRVAPVDLVAMVGSGGVRCYVVPSMKLVVVRFGTGRGFEDGEFLGRLFGK